MYIVPSNKKIIDAFYDEVLPEITSGNLHIGEMTHGIHFNIKIGSDEQIESEEELNNSDLPTMIIKDKKTFNANLVSLIQEMYDVRIPMKWKNVPSYVKNDRDCLKYYLSNIWSNMTFRDFENPEEYMTRYLSFLNDSTFKYKKVITGPIEKLNGCHLEITTVEKDATSETPYAFRIKISDETGKRKYVLPDIIYGIEDSPYGKKVYICAIQEDWSSKKENKSDPEFSSKMNRLLYRVRKGVSEDESMGTQADSIGAEENIADVTASAIAGLTAVMSLFNQEDINNIVIQSNFPVRWESVRMVNEEELELDSKEYNYSEEQINKKREEYNLEQDKDGRNITDKMIRNFRKLAYHFDGINIIAFPFDVDDCMYVKLGTDLEPNNPDHLLTQISQSIGYQKNNRTR